MASLTKRFTSDPLFNVEVVASGTALRILREHGIRPAPFELRDGRDFIGADDDPDELLVAADSIVRERKPDVILASVSSFGCGIDEALLVSRAAKTYGMQDFWGDVNLSLGVPAETYLVVDDDAARLSRERWGVRTVVVGAPKYDRYADFDVLKTRSEVRRELNVRSDQAVIGMFAQSPEIPGHAEAMRDLVTAAGDLDPSPLLLLREHPKFVDARDEHVRLATMAGLQYWDATDSGPVEPWLAACDVVATCFSLCAVDHGYLAGNSREPIGSVLYLMTNQKIRESMHRLCGIEELPTVKRGLGHVADSRSSLSHQLEYALADVARSRYHEASKELAATDACGRVAQVISRGL